MDQTFLEETSVTLKRSINGSEKRRIRIRPRTEITEIFRRAAEITTAARGNQIVQSILTALFVGNDVGLMPFSTGEQDRHLTALTDSGTRRAEVFEPEGITDLLRREFALLLGIYGRVGRSIFGDDGVEFIQKGLIDFGRTDSFGDVLTDALGRGLAPTLNDGGRGGSVSIRSQ